jgi:hypothetical protein
MPDLPVLYFAIPVMDEAETLPQCLDCIELQSYRNIKVFICINQPDSYWSDPLKAGICINNRKTLQFLIEKNHPDIIILDKSSKGNGWTGKKHGVGWARKTTMDFIANMANSEDIIVCMDADTTFNKDFCKTIINQFEQYPNAAGISLPYYHRLTGDETLDRSMLHYEIYMRYYAINLFRIHNPYCFTAIGSSMAVKVLTYKAVRGMSPKLSGEDFYFMQKLRKHGSLIIWNEESTYPATRYSERVFFGTGPALIKGSRGQWESYPMYSYKLFDKVKETFDLFDTLFIKDAETPMTAFLEETFNTTNLWQPIRDNFRTLSLFRKSCAEKVDGLRILQFLKSNQAISDHEEKYMAEYLELFFPKLFKENRHLIENFSFNLSPKGDLDAIRNLLTEIELEYRKQHNIINWY